jgi:hypothetical protein
VKSNTARFGRHPIQEYCPRCKGTGRK